MRFLASALLLASLAGCKVVHEDDAANRITTVVRSAADRVEATLSGL